MGALFDEFDDLANELMNGDFAEAKYPIILTNAGSYNPSTGTTTGGSNQTLAATRLEFNQSQFDGANIKIGDLLVMVRNKELTINILKGITSFEFQQGSTNGGTIKGKVINTSTDPLGVTTQLQLRAG